MHPNDSFIIKVLFVIVRNPISYQFVKYICLLILKLNSYLCIYIYTKSLIIAAILYHFDQ